MLSILTCLSFHGPRLCPTGFTSSEWVPAKFPHHQLEPQQPRPHVLWVHLPAEGHPGQGVVSLTHLISPCPVYPSHSSNLHLLTDCFSTSLYPNFLSSLSFQRQNHVCLPHSRMNKERLRNGSLCLKSHNELGAERGFKLSSPLLQGLCSFTGSNGCPQPLETSLTHSPSSSILGHQNL